MIFPGRNDFKPHKIVIDGVFFQFRDNSGIVRVWSSLLNEWSGTSFGQSLLILDRDGAAPKFPGIGGYIPFHPYYSRNAAAESFLLQEVCDQANAALFVSTHLTTPLETPSLLLVHDLIPEIFGHDETWLREKRYCTYHAAGYAAVSNHTLEDLHRLYPFSKYRPACVAHNGVGGIFFRSQIHPANAFKNKHGIKNSYFLLVGRRSEHKNAELFFRAFASLPGKERFTIVCCGGEPELESELKEHARGCDVNVMSLSDEQLHAAYSEAVCLIYPSRYEGFGLPVIEAMAAGCPVITSPSASIPEVAGDAVKYVGDTDIDGMIQALIDIQETGMRENLITAGRIRAKAFTWTKSAQEIEQLAARVLRTHVSVPQVQAAWRDLRSYQCRPGKSLKAMAALEEAWFSSIQSSVPRQADFANLRPRGTHQ